MVLKSKDLTSRVVLPEDCVLSKHSYLRAREPSELVSITVRPGVHGLVGKPGNRTSWSAKKKFIEFIRCNRTPTGRTAFGDDGYHGAQYYLSTQFTSIKAPMSRRSKCGNKRSLEAAADVLTDDDAASDMMQLSGDHQPQVLAHVFRTALKTYAPDVQGPSDTTVQVWFNELFGSPSAEFGHTSLFPHKTDACSTCSELDMEVSKLNASIARHLQHVEDAGSIARQQALAELRVQLQEVMDRCVCSAYLSTGMAS